MFGGTRGRCGARVGGVVWDPTGLAPDRGSRGRDQRAADSARCKACCPGVERQRSGCSREVVADEELSGAAQMGLRTRSVAACQQENSAETRVSTDTEMVEQVEGLDHH